MLYRCKNCSDILISLITSLNVQKLQIFAIFASYLVSIVNTQLGK